MSTTEVITGTGPQQAVSDRPQTVRSEPEAKQAAAAPPRKWMIGPWFDLLLVANLAWPLLVAAVLAWPALLSGSGFYFNDGPLSILQLYFISTPHRWITLVLVFCDPDRFRENSRKFIGYGSGLLLFGLLLAGVGYLTVDWRAPGSDLSTRLMESLAFMMMVDFMWNSWHFAAQHAGINAIYRRMGQVEKTEKQIAFEMSSIRLLVLWTFIRIGLAATASKHNLFAPGGVGHLFVIGDVFFIGRAGYVIFKDLFAGGLRRPGRSAYLISMLTLYAAILAAIQFMSNAWLKGLLISQAIFHGTEYLAVVYWSVQKRRSGIWKFHLARGVFGVALFIAIIGIGNWALDRQSAYIWALLTLLVSLLHYSYDGMIWKSKRKPKPAAGAGAAKTV